MHDWSWFLENFSLSFQDNTGMHGYGFFFFNHHIIRISIFKYIILKFQFFFLLQIIITFIFLQLFSTVKGRVPAIHGGSRTHLPRGSDGRLFCRSAEHGHWSGFCQWPCGEGECGIWGIDRWQEHRQYWRRLEHKGQPCISGDSVLNCPVRHTKCCNIFQSGDQFTIRKRIWSYVLLSFKVLWGGNVKQ